MEQYIPIARTYGMSLKEIQRCDNLISITLPPRWRDGVLTASVALSKAMGCDVSLAVRFMHMGTVFGETDPMRIANLGVICVAEFAAELAQIVESLSVIAAVYTYQHYSFTYALAAIGKASTIGLFGYRAGDILRGCESGSYTQTHLTNEEIIKYESILLSSPRTAYEIVKDIILNSIRGQQERLAVEWEILRYRTIFKHRKN